MGITALQSIWTLASNLLCMQHYNNNWSAGQMFCGWCQKVEIWSAVVSNWATWPAWVVHWPSPAERSLCAGGHHNSQGHIYGLTMNGLGRGHSSNMDDFSTPVVHHFVCSPLYRLPIIYIEPYSLFECIDYWIYHLDKHCPFSITNLRKVLLSELLV